MRKTKGGNPEAEFPSQMRGPGLPPKVRVARGAAQINVNNLRGGSKNVAQATTSSSARAPEL